MTTSNKGNVSRLIAAVDKLMTGKRGCSFAPVPGHIRLATGAWIARGILPTVLARLDEAVEIDSAPHFALSVRADIKLAAGLSGGSKADCELLKERQSPYADGILPLRIALALGDKAAATRYLGAVNERNRSKGLPLYRLSEFKLHLVGKPLTKADMTTLRAEVEAWAAYES